MRREVASDLTWSSQAFLKVVWPAISGCVGGGKLLPVESVSEDDFRSDLDRIAGIDAWVVQQDRHIFGLASRVQAYKPEWDRWWPSNTFTIRTFRPGGVRTEYAKRKDQMNTPGSIYPRWTCHAYLNSQCTELETVAVALTAHVIGSVGRIGNERVNYSGEKFWITPWWGLWQDGCESLNVLYGPGYRVRWLDRRRAA